MDLINQPQLKTKMKPLKQILPENIRHTFNVGKLAYKGTRKINPATISVELTYRKTGGLFSTSLDNETLNEFIELRFFAHLSNSRDTEFIEGETTMSIMALYIQEQLSENTTVAALCKIFNEWYRHYEMRGTVKQINFIKEYIKKVNYYDNEENISALKEAGIYIDNGITYNDGIKTYIRPITEEVINEIKELIALDKQKQIK